MVMASLAAAGLLSLGAGTPVIRAASCPAAAPSRIRVRSAARLTLRCSAPSDRNTTAGLPPWMSVEQLIQLRKAELAAEERLARESKEATAAMKGAVAGLLLHPLRGLFDDLRNLKTVYDIEEFHIGLPVGTRVAIWKSIGDKTSVPLLTVVACTFAGAVMAGVAVHHLWKAAPSAFVDLVLHYAFYRLGVMAADVRRRGFAPDVIIRLKLCQFTSLVIQ